MTEKMDQQIAALINSVEHSIPAAVEQELSQKLQHTVKKKRTNKIKRCLWYPATAMATLALALFILLPFLGKGDHDQKPIEEIKTVFELKEKNITIIWMQKKDFQLRRTES